jgi:hypothetical protein
MGRAVKLARYPRTRRPSMEQEIHCAPFGKQELVKVSAPSA